MVQIFDLYDRVLGVWEKKRGLMLTIGALVLIYFSIYAFFNQTHSITDPVHWSLLFGILVLSVCWLISTNRLVFKSAEKISVFISIVCEDNFELKAKTLIGFLVKRLKSDRNFRLINVSLLPVNTYTDSSRIEDWLHTQTGDRNAVILLDFQDGKVEAEETVIVQKMSCTGFFKKSSVMVDGEALNIKSELALRMQERDWKLLEKNSLQDKEKIRNNVRDILLYFSGLLYLNEQQFEKARITLKQIHQPEGVTVPGVRDKDNPRKLKIELKTNHIQAARLHYLQTQIYLKCIFELLLKERAKDALKLLQELDQFSLPPDEKVRIYINFAHTYYLLSDLVTAKQYTLKVKQLSPNSLAYFANMGFFAAIENDPSEFIKYYSVIDRSVTIDAPAIPMIAFMEDRKEKYADCKVLLEAATAILTKMFVDEDEGNTMLRTVIADAVDSKYKRVKKLCEKRLRQKLPKDSSPDISKNAA